MAHFPYLMSRNGHYYFRMAIPTLLVCKFQRKEFTYTLKTKDQCTAKLRCWAMVKVANLIFEAIKTMPRITPEQAKEIAQAYFKECMDRLEYQLDAADQYSAGMAKLANNPDLKALKSLDHTTDIHRFDFLLPDNFSYDGSDVVGMSLGYSNHCDGDIEKIVEYLADKHELEAAEGTLSYKTLEQGIRTAVDELLKIHERKTALESDVTPSHEWFKEAKQQHMPANDPKGSSEKTSEIFKKYLAECKGDTTRTIKAKEVTHRLLVEILGDLPVNALTKTKGRELKETLLKLPSNMKQRYPNKAIRELDLNSILENERLSVATINKHLSKLVAYINWAIKQGYYEGDNPFEGLQLNDSVKDDQKRNPFSQAQLQAIFSAPIFTGCKDATDKGRNIAGNKIIKDHKYWIPLIALYTGARLQEICQLYVSDIKQVHNIWVFDINDNGQDKRLKNASSKRYVPIHPELIKQGILEYRKKLENTGVERMFHKLSRASDGTYSSNFSKSFNYFLTCFDIKDDKTSFHSFRHNFIDAMRNTDVHAEVRQALVGHTGNKTVHDNYGSPMGVKRLHDGITKLEYKVFRL